MSWFSDVSLVPPIEVFDLVKRFNEDSDANKVNLTIGAYRDDNGKPVVLPVVRNVENQIASDTTLNHEYLPVLGLPDYTKEASTLLLGADSPVIGEGRADGVQALGGTGALRIAFDFLKTRLGLETLYVSTPTWGNHKNMATACGFKLKEYRYWDETNRAIDLQGLLEDFRNAPEKSVMVLHVCAHNPTGMDPSQDQWKEIATVMKERNLFVLFDCAYQGFASGDLDGDAWPVRYFASQGFELMAAQSFSKNFGLYNERVGNLTYITNDASKIPNIKSHLTMIVRTTWSNSPSHGCRVVATVLKNPQLKQEWKEFVKTMAERILAMRKMLYDKLRALGTPGSWEHIINQSGMFSYTGLNKNQCNYLMDNYHIYLLRSGRINMCGLTTKNMDYVAKAFDDVVRNVSAEPSISKV